jgi:dGTPase
MSAQPMQWETMLSHRRLRSESEARQISFGDLGEDPFEDDYDFIVFSQPFRRLKDKTQVYPLSENDHVRTRLSHSLEAACIGQYLGSAVGSFIINEHGLDRLKYHRLHFGGIVKAACLAHDIGHPPLGNIGEKRRFANGFVQ